MICCGSDSLCSCQYPKIWKELWLRLGAPISGNLCWSTKSSNPCIHQCFYAGLGSNVWNWYCLWPPGKTVNYSEEILFTCRLWQRANNSICMWENLPSGAENVPSCALICLCTFDFWHGTHEGAHTDASLLIFGQKYFWVSNFLLAFTPGCARLWTVSKTFLLKESGTYSLFPLVVSYHNSWFEV